MISLPENTLPVVRSPTVSVYRKQKVLPHAEIIASTVLAFRQIHDVPAHFQLTTTPDGLDAVMWATIKALRYIRHDDIHYSVAIVHSNSRRQKTAFYGGLTGPGWSVVFDKHLLKVKNADLDALMRESVSRWTMFLDFYPERMKRLKNVTLTRSKYNTLLVSAADAGYLAWSRLGPFHDERPDNESALGFLQRFSRHVGRQPPLSHEPARSQPWSLHGMYVSLCEEVNP